MHDRPSPARVAGNFVEACAECGSVSHERQYARIESRHTCEHCFLRHRKHHHDLGSDPYEGFVEALADALDYRERETGLHSKRVATYTLLLAAHCYDDNVEMREVYWGSLLHDIGKIGVPDATLLKPDRLSDEEWTVMRQHPQIGHEILKRLPFLSMAADVVLCHEERYDGSGYPRRLKGSEIPLAARLFAVIDTLDAMTFDRPYRKALPFDTARAEIVKMSGSQFDPAVVDIFLREEAALREMTAMEFPTTPGAGDA